MLAKVTQTRPEPGVAVVDEILPEWMPKDILAPIIYTAEHRAKCSAYYGNSTPYHFLRIDELLNVNAMLAIRKEVMTQLKTFHRETDLYKVNQSIDFNNITLDSDLAKDIPYLMSLRQHLYSPTFRKFLEETLDCGKLSDRVDMAANEYKCGLQLGCHDDGVQATRKQSFIVYASMPDVHAPLDSQEEWMVQHGGYLELYPGVAAPVFPTHGQTGLDSVDLPVEGVVSVPVPLPYPSKTIAPQFNTMVIFEVKPGESFHSVQEVYGIDSNRVSIQGWFHAVDPKPVPENMVATVRLIQAPIQALPDTYADLQVPSKESVDLIMNNQKLSSVKEEEVKRIVRDMYYESCTTEFGLYSQSKKTTSVSNDQLIQSIVDTLIDAELALPENMCDGDEVDLDSRECILNDLAYLRKWINPAYTSVKTLNQMREEFVETGVLSLSEFLQPQLNHSVLQAVLDVDIEFGLSCMEKCDEDEDEDDDEEENAFVFDLNNTEKKPFNFLGTGTSTEEEDEDVEEDVEEDEDYEEDDEDEEEGQDKLFPPSYTTGLVYEGEETTKIGKIAKWVLSGPPHKRRLLSLQYTSEEKLLSAKEALAMFEVASYSEKLSLVLRAIQTRLLGSTAFARLIQWLTGAQPVAIKSDVRWFRAGLDYTVGSYDELVAADEQVIFANLCFVDDMDDEKASIWQSDDCGGFQAFVPVDRTTEGDDAETYVGEDDESGQVVSLSAISNTLNLVRGNKDTLSFVRYVNGHAPSSRFDIHCKIHVYDEAANEEE